MQICLKRRKFTFSINLSYLESINFVHRGGHDKVVWTSCIYAHTPFYLNYSIGSPNISIQIPNSIKTDVFFK